MTFVEMVRAFLNFVYAVLGFLVWLTLLLALPFIPSLVAEGMKRLFRGAIGTDTGAGEIQKLSFEDQRLHKRIYEHRIAPWFAELDLLKQAAAKGLISKQDAQSGTESILKRARGAAIVNT